MSFAARVSRSAPPAALSRRAFVSVAALGQRATLASIKTDAPTASLSLVLQAGARHEPAAGAAAVLQHWALQSNHALSALALARSTEQAGGVLSATLTREHLLLTADFVPGHGNEEFFLKTLKTTLTPKFLAHEFNERVRPAVAQASQQAAHAPAVSALELAHRVAFRKGLGHSLFADAHHPPRSADAVALFHGALGGKIGVIGQGVDHATLSGWAGDLFGEELDRELDAAHKRQPFPALAGGGPTQYYGGEERVPLDLHLLPDGAKPTLVLAYGVAEAASAEARVLPHLLGVAPALKWSAAAATSSPLLEAASHDAGSTATAALHAYSDAALLTVEVQAEGSKRLSETAKRAVAAVQQLAAGKLADAHVHAAVARAKFEAAATADVAHTAHARIAQTMFAAGQGGSIAETFKALDAVTPESLAKALRTFTAAKPTVVAIARLDELAYADELGLKL